MGSGLTSSRVWLAGFGLSAVAASLVALRRASPAGAWTVLAWAAVGALATSVWFGALVFGRRVPLELAPAVRLRIEAGGALVLAAAAAIDLLSPRAWIVLLPSLGLVLGWVLFPAAEVVRRSGQRMWVTLRPRVPWLVFGGSLALVFVQSYRRHFWFGSTGKDLGLFHQTHWLLSRLEAPENTVMSMHAFSDHLELLDLAAAPLQWLWPDVGALLFFQAVLVAAGAAAVTDWAACRLESRAAGAAFGLAFLLGIDMQNAVMFDWNPTTCGAGLLPWVVWGLERRRFGVFVAALVGVAAAKENLVLYALALCLAWVLASRQGREPGVRNPAERAALVAAAALAFLFVLEMQVVFPLLRPGGFRHLRYEELGQSVGEILASVLRAPQDAVALLVTPAVKIDGLAAALASTAFLALLAPPYLIALAPMILERFWSTHVNRWWGYHYGAAMTAVAVLAAIAGLARLRRHLSPPVRPLATRALSLAVVTSTLLVAVGIPSRPKAPLLRLQPGYAAAPVDCEDARAVLRVIPKAATVAAQNHLIPHLSARREIRELQRPITADYVALHFGQGAWPFAADYPRRLARHLVASGYGIVACRGRAMVLRRGVTGIACAALMDEPGAIR